MGQQRGTYYWDDDSLSPGNRSDGGWSQNLFDDDGNLLARQCGLHQCAHKLGVAAGAVDGHFDGQHIRIGCGFAYHLDNRIERLIRVVQQDRRLFDQFEHGAVFA